MTIQLKVPTIACEVCAETITKALKNSEPNAEVKVNMETKIVTVDSKESVAKIKQLISDAGHSAVLLS
jgi:copper chaperone